MNHAFADLRIPYLRTRPSFQGNPMPTTYMISSNPASVNESAGTLTFTVTRSNSNAAATVYASTAVARQSG